MAVPVGAMAVPVGAMAVPVGACSGRLSAVFLTFLWNFRAQLELYPRIYPVCGGRSQLAGARVETISTLTVRKGARS
jgi:hypothetical protein